MQIIEHTIETTATPLQIWEVWKDVKNWKTWDREIEFSQIDGPFQTGTTGCTKFVDTPPFKIQLTEVKPYESVIEESYLYFAKVISYQSMIQTAKTQVTFRVEIRGPLSFFYALMIGRFIKRKIPPAMKEMVKRALALS